MLGARPVAATNRLLALLPRKELQLLQPCLETVSLSYADVLHEPQVRMRYVYFPIDCLVSLLTAVDAQRAAEVGLVGAEGMVGVSAVLGMPDSPFLAVVQGGGAAMRIKVSDLQREIKKTEVLQRELFHFTHLLMTQVAQTAACNRFHVVTQRMARWLLTTRDRVHSTEFRITQQFMARMLGVRRVGVSEAASQLQARKLISYNRGNITILDQKGLAAAACSCYKVVKDIYAKAEA